MVGTNELVFCHGDLDCNNTLIDSDNQVGVIDFGDAGLYDRSQDFRGMDDEILQGSMLTCQKREARLSIQPLTSHWITISGRKSLSYIKI